MNDDCVIKFLSGLNDEFSHVRSQIMLIEPMHILVKIFFLILQQEREFNVTFHYNSQDSIINLAFNEGHSKNFHSGLSGNRGRGRFTQTSGHNPNHTSDNCCIKHGLT